MQKIGEKIVAFLEPGTIEPQALAQLYNVASLPFIYKHVAVMADCHLGKGATVGSVIATKGAVVPAAVGVDLGCLDPDTEFLSPEGWKKISEWNGDAVCQYDPASRGYVRYAAGVDKETE
jgi:hypothetical protein